ncbi:YhbY family RNA-binding protein [Nitrincola sp. MINF-07-Sa-05]|uniref:YhbY family RNA-binding protein n=1 Tax=Nitrincola salilacus TaxID=3400273 RepID=UPI003918180B
MSLTPEQKKQFRTIGHRLNPIVMIAGNGLTENIQLEVDRALEDHELIKVRFTVGDRELKRKLINELCEIVEAEAVQVIGNIALVYRAAKDPNPKLSNLLRPS